MARTRPACPTERIEAELFTDGGKDAVVRMPGRQFPGVWCRAVPSCQAIGLGSCDPSLPVRTDLGVAVEPRRSWLFSPWFPAVPRSNWCACGAAATGGLTLSPSYPHLEYSRATAVQVAAKVVLWAAVHLPVELRKPHGVRVEQVDKLDQLSLQ
ncbi:DUF6959 family protein [Streptomyces chartreusis]|uniref:DUF6959 family protein n=1 Tax=Streptomyces chartreusis TaxID=1969 RepID=UPI003682CA14